MIESLNEVEIDLIRQAVDLTPVKLRMRASSFQPVHYWPELIEALKATDADWRLAPPDLLLILTPPGRIGTVYDELIADNLSLLKGVKAFFMRTTVWAADLSTAPPVFAVDSRELPSIRSGRRSRFSFVAIVRLPLSWRLFGQARRSVARAVRAER